MKLTGKLKYTLKHQCCCIFSVRLQNGPSRQFGRVEMYQESTEKWHQLCHDGSFDNVAANVACKQLGYSTGQPFCCSSFGVYSRNSIDYIQNISCTGNEDLLENCTYTLGKCTSNNYMSLYCPNTTANATLGMYIHCDVCLMMFSF